MPRFPLLTADVPLVALDGTPEPEVKLIGRGFVNPPGSGAPKARTGTPRCDGSRMICGDHPDNHHRSFILSPHPVLAPRTSGVATLMRSRPGSPAPRRRSPGATKVRDRWSRSRSGPSKVIGRGRRHTLRKADRGTLIPCSAEGCNAGGHASAYSRELRIAPLIRQARGRDGAAARALAGRQCGRLPARGAPALARMKGRRTRPLRGSGRAGRSGSWEEGQDTAGPRLAC